MRPLAIAKNVPAYAVFAGKTLPSMVLLKPQTRDQMAKDPIMRQSTSDCDYQGITIKFSGFGPDLRASCLGCGGIRPPDVVAKVRL